MDEQISRRRFLSATVGISAAAVLGGADTLFGRGIHPSEAMGEPPPMQRKLIVIVFGGGTRSSESVDDPEHKYIPHLWNEMVPTGQDLLLTQRYLKSTEKPMQHQTQRLGHLSTLRFWPRPERAWRLVTEPGTRRTLLSRLPYHAPPLSK